MRIPTTRRTHSLVAASRTAVALAVVGSLWALGSNAVAAPTAVGLGTAGSFAVLAGETGIHNTGPTTIMGDIGTFPGTSITGASDVTLLSGTNHADDSVTQGAKTDLVTAYDTAAGEVPPTGTITADLAGVTLTPGVYKSPGTIHLSVGGVLTLDPGSDPNPVWVFQAGSDLVTESGSKVVMLNGAPPSCNVYWQVVSSATLGTNSTFIGTIMALTSISLQTGAKLDGRALARDGAVTLDSNTITRPACSTSTSTSTPTATTPSTSTRTGAAQITAVPRGPVGTGDNSIG